MPELPPGSPDLGTPPWNPPLVAGWAALGCVSSFRAFAGVYPVRSLVFEYPSIDFPSRHDFGIGFMGCGCMPGVVTSSYASLSESDPEIDPSGAEQVAETTFGDFLPPGVSYKCSDRKTTPPGCYCTCGNVSEWSTPGYPLFHQIDRRKK